MDNPDITKIAAIIIDEQKRVLIVKSKSKDYWYSLGGKIEDGEDHISCLKREVKEEVGLDVVSAELFIETPVIPTDNNDGRTLKNYFYLVKADGEIRLNPEDQIVDFKWVSKEEFETEIIKNKSYKIGSGLEHYAFPELIKKGLI